MFDYYSLRWRKLRCDALERADFRCEHIGCPVRHGLHVHHIQSVSKHPELAFEPSNLVVLCLRHHAQMEGHGFMAIRSRDYSEAANDDQFDLPLLVEGES